MSIKILQGDCREVLKTLPPGSVHCAVTSPPYFGLRNYNHENQIGLEASPDEYVAQLVAVFREVRRALRDYGTLWLNLGDSYYNYRPGGHEVKQTMAKQRQDNPIAPSKRTSKYEGIKEKDLIGIPWMVAFALRADGWFLRQEIIWSKPNPMPESVTDRCTKAHEHIFLLTKSKKYYFDADAIQEPCETLDDRPHGVVRDRVLGYDSKQKVLREERTRKSGNLERKTGSERGCPENTGSNVCGSVPWEGTTRNKRSVWHVAPKPFLGAHFATYPAELIEPCILAGCPEGGVVLDPFFGAGTTGLVADRLRRDCIGVELNPSYIEMAHNRLHDDAGLFSQVERA